MLPHRPADGYLGGLWELPAGGVDTCESLIEALRRKVAEETGLTIAAIDWFLGHFDYLPKSGKQPDAVTADAASMTHPAHGSRTRPEYQERVRHSSWSTSVLMACRVPWPPSLVTYTTAVRVPPRVTPPRVRQPSGSRG
ncbi:NUDIX hydrolase [Streptomyces sp. NPDC059679]|uniref:NUDIX hydrolase n=1 Tax=Streptomyces sp. NPDC059679 TaxID=3346903 RepID=UPI0036C945DD